MKRIFSFVASVAVLFAMVANPAAARGLASHQHAKPFSVGIVLDVGGINDKSFNHLAYVGLQYSKAHYHISGSYVVSKSQQDYVPFLTAYARQHKDLIIANGFLMQSAVYTVAKQFPTQKFAMVDGSPLNPTTKKNENLPNVANLFFKEQESGYLVGVMAGLMEKQKVGSATHGTIGYMGGIPVPAVIHYEAGYVAGAKKVDPSIKVLGGYSQSFTDQTKANTIGASQISQGADVLFAVAGQSGLGYLRAAQEKNLYGIGFDADQADLGSYILSSAIKKVDVAVELTIRRAMTGHFKAGDTRFSLQNGSTGYGKVSSTVPASIVAQMKKYAKQIKAGTIVPPSTLPS